MKMIQRAAIPTALVTVALLSGCASPYSKRAQYMPNVSQGGDGCAVNQTLTGAITGAGLGTAIGAIASQGSAAGTLAGAAIGMLIGGAIGQQQDQACHEMALKAAFEQAEADRRAYEAQQAQLRAQEDLAASNRELAQANRELAQVNRALVQASQQPKSEPTQPAIQYKPIAWHNKQTGNGGTITPTNNFTDAVTGRNCWSFEDRPIAANGTAGPPVMKKACMGADGSVVAVN